MAKRSKKDIVQNLKYYIFQRNLNAGFFEKNNRNPVGFLLFVRIA